MKRNIFLIHNTRVKDMSLSHSFGYVGKALLVGGALVLSLVFLAGVRGVFSFIQVPVLAVSGWIGVHTSVLSDVADDIQLRAMSKEMLIEEVRNLREEVADSEFLTLRASVLLDENEELRSLLGTASDEPIVRSGRVVRVAQGLNTTTLVVGAGSSDGVSEGDFVLAHSGVLLGVAGVVTENVTLVQLVTSSRVRTPVFVGDNGGTLFTLEGAGGMHGVVRAPRDAPVSEGDSIASAYGPWILGIVEGVSFDPRDPFQAVYVRSPVNVHTIRFVSFVPARDVVIEETLEHYDEEEFFDY